MASRRFPQRHGHEEGRKPANNGDGKRSQITDGDLFAKAQLTDMITKAILRHRHIGSSSTTASGADAIQLSSAAVSWPDTVRLLADAVAGPTPFLSGGVSHQLFAYGGTTTAASSSALSTDGTLLIPIFVALGDSDLNSRAVVTANLGLLDRHANVVNDYAVGVGTAAPFGGPAVGAALYSHPTAPSSQPHATAAFARTAAVLLATGGGGHTNDGGGSGGAAAYNHRLRLLMAAGGGGDSDSTFEGNSLSEAAFYADPFLSEVGQRGGPFSSACVASSFISGAAGMEMGGPLSSSSRAVPSNRRCSSSRGAFSKGVGTATTLRPAPPSPRKTPRAGSAAAAVTANSRNRAALRNGSQMQTAVTIAAQPLPHDDGEARVGAHTNIYRFPAAVTFGRGDYDGCGYGIGGGGGDGGGGGPTGGASTRAVGGAHNIDVNKNGNIHQHHPPRIIVALAQVPFFGPTTISTPPSAAASAGKRGKRKAAGSGYAPTITTAAPQCRGDVAASPWEPAFLAQRCAFRVYCNADQHPPTADGSTSVGGTATSTANEWGRPSRGNGGGYGFPNPPQPHPRKITAAAPYQSIGGGGGNNNNTANDKDLLEYSLNALVIDHTEAKWRGGSNDNDYGHCGEQQQGASSVEARKEEAKMVLRVDANGDDDDHPLLLHSIGASSVTSSALGGTLRGGGLLISTPRGVGGESGAAEAGGAGSYDGTGAKADDAYRRRYQQAGSWGKGILSPASSAALARRSQQQQQNNNNNNNNNNSFAHQTTLLGEVGGLFDASSASNAAAIAHAAVSGGGFGGGGTRIAAFEANAEYMYEVSKRRNFQLSLEASIRRAVGRLLLMPRDKRGAMIGSGGEGSGSDGSHNSLLHTLPRYDGPFDCSLRRDRSGRVAASAPLQQWDWHCFRETLVDALCVAVSDALSQ